MSVSNVICLNALRNRSGTDHGSRLDTSDDVRDVAREITQAYADLTIRATERGLNIASVNTGGFPISLMLLEDSTYYLSLGLAEIEVYDGQQALDFVLLACSRSSRLLTTEVAGHVRDWRFELQLDTEWHCVHRGGFPRFAPWRRATCRQFINERPIPACAKASRRRIFRDLGAFQLSTQDENAMDCKPQQTDAVSFVRNWIRL